jgi:hypothetical protein
MCPYEKEDSEILACEYPISYIEVSVGNELEHCALRLLNKPTLKPIAPHMKKGQFLESLSSR